MERGEGAVVTVVGMGVVYLIAVALVETLLLGVVGAIILAGVIIALIIYVLRNPIRTIKGWVIFLCGAITLISLPYVFVYVVVMGSDLSGDMSSVDGFHTALLPLCFFWLVADLWGVGLLYDSCEMM